MKIDTANFEKPVLIVLLIVILALVAFTAYEAGQGHANAAPIVSPTPASTPVPVTTPDIPTGYWTGDLLVTSLTTGAGWPEAIVADGRGFRISYNDYDTMSANSWANFYVTSTFNPYGTTIYVAQSVNIEYTRQYPVYYHSNNNYYRDDGRISVTVNRDEAIAHGRILEAVPPHYRR